MLHELTALNDRHEMEVDMSTFAAITEATQTRPTAGGWTTLLFGIVFLVIGLPFATNFRGCLDRWAKDQPETPAALKKLPPWKWSDPDPRTTARIVTTVFAVVGPFVVVLVRIATGNS
ncbi:hypothetical protein ACGFNU_03280 [Spirillospora sp. NPDC048911]|uniref:hypothetical protein n=1 Tax=Spirillospora sp. NPDC048911 TaxID=3364527 RepID=UPI003720BCBB